MIRQRLSEIVVATVVGVSMFACHSRSVPIVEWPSEVVEKVARRSPAPVFPVDVGVNVPTARFYAEIRIDTVGQVESVRIPAHVPPRFSQVVRAAVLKWNFSSSKLSDGRLARGMASVRFVFNTAERKVIVGSDRENRPEATIKRLPFAKFAPAPGIMLLDLRDRPSFRRSHRNGALNLPAEELATRVEGEIGNDVTVALDCERIPKVVCENAATELLNRRRNVILLFANGGTRY